MLAQTGGSPNPVMQVLVAIAFAIPPLIFLGRGLMVGPRSRRFANFALFFGLLTFVMPEITVGFGAEKRPTLFVISGVVRAAFGLIGLALAVTALLTRRDGGTGVARPLIGLGFNLLHVAFAVGLVVVGTAVQPPPTGPGGTEWVYQPPHSDYRLTLPSSDWKEVPPVGGVGEASFTLTYPRTFCTVWEPLRSKSEADFMGMVTEFRAMTKGNPNLLGEPTHWEGKNPAGHHCYLSTTFERGPFGRTLFTAFALTWCAEKKQVVKMALQGEVISSSLTVRETELTAMGAAAERILLSVE